MPLDRVLAKIIITTVKDKHMAAKKKKKNKKLCPCCGCAPCKC